MFHLCLYYFVFIHSSVDGHWDCFHLWLLWVMLIWTWVFEWLFEILRSAFWHLCEKSELLGLCLFVIALAWIEELVEEWSLCLSRDSIHHWVFTLVPLLSHHMPSCRSVTISWLSHLERVNNFQPYLTSIREENLSETIPSTCRLSPAILKHEIGQDSWGFIHSDWSSSNKLISRLPLASLESLWRLPTSWSNH